MEVSQPRPGRKTDRRQTSHNPTLAEQVVISRRWKSARDRRNTIVISFKEFEGRKFLDIRLFSTNASGQSVPTAKGVTVGIGCLDEFVGDIQKAHRKAIELGLIDEPAG